MSTRITDAEAVLLRWIDEEADAVHQALHHIAATNERDADDIERAAAEEPREGTDDVIVRLLRESAAAWRRKADTLTMLTDLAWRAAHPEEAAQADDEAAAVNERRVGA